MRQTPGHSVLLHSVISVRRVYVLTSSSEKPAHFLLERAAGHFNVHQSSFHIATVGRRPSGLNFVIFLLHLVWRIAFYELKLFLNQKQVDPSEVTHKPVVSSAEL